MSSFKLKIIVLGAADAKKTAFIVRFVNPWVLHNYKLTSGVDIFNKDVEFHPGEIATLSIWDVGNQHRFEFIRSTFYKGAAGALIIFDLNRERTYVEAKKWLAEFRQYAGELIPFMLVGNKLDLIDEVGEIVDRKEARDFAESQGGSYIEVSDKTGENIAEAFLEITRRVIYSRTGS